MIIRLFPQLLKIGGQSYFQALMKTAGDIYPVGESCG